MKLTSSCASLRFVIALTALITAQTSHNSLFASDWAYDFDGPAPAGWYSVSQTLNPLGLESATFAAEIQPGPSSNLLRLSDFTVAADGGSFAGFAGTSDVFTGVLVEADVNVAMDTDDDLGIVARANPATGSSYFAHIDFELGNACITKVQNFATGIDMECSAQGLFSSSESYTMQLTALGGATTTLTLDVVDSMGDTTTVIGVDDGSLPGFGAAYTSGVSGVFLVPLGTTLDDAAANPINGTFDQVSSQSVPEPTGMLLIVGAFLSFAGLRQSRK